MKHLFLILLLVLLACLPLVSEGSEEELKYRHKVNSVIEFELKMPDWETIELWRYAYNSYWGPDKKITIKFDDLKFLFDNIEALKKIVEYTAIYEQANELEKQIIKLRTSLENNPIPKLEEADEKGITVPDYSNCPYHGE